MRLVAALAIAALSFLPPACAAQPKASVAAEAPVAGDWGAATKGLTRSEGFLDLYVDAKGGRVLAAFPAPDGDGLSLRAIHSAGLTAGLGSNPIGLDRGYFDEGGILAFRRVGKKLVAEKENWTYRASADNPLERKAVRESFARSFLWSGDIIAEGADGALLVDLSGFLTRDALDVRGALKANEDGGTFAIAEDRTMPDTGAAFAFPDNVEFDAFLTLMSDDPKSQVRATAADARAFTLVQHQSLVRLPDDGYTPRPFDPRSGAIDVGFYDFSAPLSGQVRQSFARRFRLEKQDPTAASSPAKTPLVFYVDSGAPEEIRNALMEGTSWWADAFTAAGFPDSFEVKVLPEGVSPLDVRYNVIQWTHRQTRGWSYGGGVYDPRTGEMLKANVILGSQRVRQDRMIFEGLGGTAKTGTGEADDPVELALDRIRQLAAHEVGHTLGFAHNFAASANDRASVMDYPAPLVTAKADGTLDFSQAYAVGIGAWDKVAARWLYGQYAPGADAVAEGSKVLSAAYASGLRFVDDPQARGTGTSHPYASVWDNGNDPIAALGETMRVRKIALAKFGLGDIRPGQPTFDLRAVLVPVYLYHRYEVAAAAKSVGGYDFQYAVNGDGGGRGMPVPADRQREALAALVATLDPAALDLPDATLNLLNTPLDSFFGTDSGAEYFNGETGAMFDLLAAADTAASTTLGALLHPARAARLVETARREPGALTYGEVLGAIEGAVFMATGAPRQATILHREQVRYVSTLIDLAAGGKATPEVVAETNGYLMALGQKLEKPVAGTDTATRTDLVRRIAAHLARPAEAHMPGAKGTDVPPGSPIGGGSSEECWHCDTALLAAGG
ncbi:MAG: zinc-dependent metalloprotease [Hyphomonas oceanitis]|uniref:zinc-dependent metalloprotease n=1 Tax=Hyphomonas oceanitis TaxID=81033 RepID=UPI0030034056